MGVIVGRSALQKMRSAYMLCYIRDDVEAKVMNTTNIDAQVPEHVKSLEGFRDSFSLPQSFSVLLPDSLQALSARSQGAAGAKAESNTTGEDSGSVEAVIQKSTRVRGTPVNVTLSGVETKVVGDLLQSLTRAVPNLEPPSTEQFMGAAPVIMPGVVSDGSGKPGGGEVQVGEPEYDICLTLVRNHMIHQVFPNDFGLADIDTAFVLRAEWCDRQPMARMVSVMHFEETPQQEEEEQQEGMEEEMRGMSFQRHGDPFVYPIYLGETVGSVKQRLQQSLGFSEEETEELELAWMTWGRAPFFMKNESVLNFASISISPVPQSPLCLAKCGPETLSFATREPKRITVKPLQPTPNTQSSDP